MSANSDSVIATICDGDWPTNPERNTFGWGAMWYLYDQYGTDNKSKGVKEMSVEEHIKKLEKMLESDSLGIEGILFILNEIWDIKIATAGTAA